MAFLVIKLIMINILMLLAESRSLNQSVLFNQFGYSFNSTKIDLSGKSIDSIDLNTFQGIDKLEFLYLEDNKLKSLQNGLFKNLINLKEIWLEHNNLVSMDKDLFFGLNNLERICLNNNPISALYPAEVNLLCKDNPKCLLLISENCFKLESPTPTPFNANTTSPDSSSVIVNHNIQAYDCFDYYKAGYRTDGIYSINPFNTNEDIKVYCEMRQGGWTRIFNRIDRGPNFNKTMREYKNGFGDLNGNYWLGLKYMNLLTNNKLMRLRIELSNNQTDFEVIEYDKFVIFPERHNFILQIGKKDFGTLRDSMSRVNGMKFSTWDQDNDLWTGNCAIWLIGGFWYWDCSQAILTGVYFGHWNDGNILYPYTFMKMLIKPN